MDHLGNSAFPIFFALSIVLVLLSCTISIQGLQCYVCVNCATPIAKPIDRTNCAEGRNATGCVTGLLYYKGDYSVNRNCLYQDNQNDVEATERCLEGGEVPVPVPYQPPVGNPFPDGGVGGGSFGGGNFGGVIGFNAKFGVKSHFGGKVTDDQYHEYSRGTDALNWDKGKEHQTSMFEFSVDPYGEVNVDAKFHFGSPA